MMTKKIKNTVTYRILIKSNTNYYKLGTIIIKRFDGDIFYTPSQKGVTNSSGNMNNKIIDHVSWHKSGRVHIKPQNGNYEIFEEGVGVLKPTTGVKKDRQKIKDIGFQEIVRDTVIEIKALPEHKKKIDELDVVFNIKEYLESVQFHFSIVSGTHIAKLAEGGETPVKVSKKSKKLLLDGQIRCLGVESGNADKILQYGLYKYIGKDLLKGRRLVMATDSNIPKIKS